MRGPLQKYTLIVGYPLIKTGSVFGEQATQSNGICERFHKTVLDEFYRVTFRKKIYNTLDELQADLHTWLRQYNEDRVHSGKYCFGKTPMQTFLDSMLLVKEKMLNNNLQADVARVSD